MSPSRESPTIDKADWSDPPKYIKPPRRWVNGGFNLIEDEYLGISLTQIFPFCLQMGDIFWLTSKTMTKLNSTGVDFIYKKHNNLYRFVSKEERELSSNISKKCSDCNGKGLYVGFNIVENCYKCKGKGFI